MKPLPSITQQRRSFRGEKPPARTHHHHPVTDSCYHAPGAELHARHGARRLISPSFRELSRSFLGTEMKRDYFAEAFFFAIIVGVSAWPIMNTMRTLAELVN